MLVSGIFIINELKDKDAEGFDRIAVVHNQMEENLTSECFLPPYLRPSQCKIKVGAKVFAFVDTVSGLGVALYGFDDADVDFINRNNYTFTETLTVEKATTLKDKLDVTKDVTSSTGDIKATIGDVVATTVSLKNHVHTVPTTPIPSAMPNNPAVPAVFPGATTTTPT